MPTRPVRSNSQEDGTSGRGVRIATFNVHMGVDGWGRPYDVVDECATLDADILVLQEAWDPDDGGPGTAAAVASRLGYRLVVSAPLAHGRLYPPVETTTTRWAPMGGHIRKTFHLDDERWKVPAGTHPEAAEPGRWGVALLSRIPCAPGQVLSLGRAWRDPAERAVVRTEVMVDGQPLVVMGTHMSHITHPSLPQYRKLARLLPDVTTAAVLVGDMNLWGPAVEALLPGWHRSVRQRTWPAHRPHSQLDHILVTPSTTVLQTDVADRTGSDHRAVVAVVAPSIGGPVPHGRPRHDGRAEG